MYYKVILLFFSSYFSMSQSVKCISKQNTYMAVECRTTVDSCTIDCCPRTMNDSFTAILPVRDTSHLLTREMTLTHISNDTEKGKPIPDYSVIMTCPKTNFIVTVSTSSWNFSQDFDFSNGTDIICLAVIDINNKVDVHLQHCLINNNNLKVYYGMVVSIIFLIITFLVYVFLPELRNLPGKCHMCYMVVLAFAYLSLTLIMMDIHLSYFICISISYVVVYTFQSSLFWLNAMCFDIWWGLRKLSVGGSEKFLNNRFLIYSVYSWGMPLLILCIIFLVEKDVIQVSVKPDFGQKCWFKTLSGALYYHYLPLTYILVVDLLFFILTLYTLVKRLNETSQVLDHHESKRHHQHTQQKIILYAKLFTIMGISWTMELVSFLFNYNWERENAKFIWKVTDVINALQGLWIFLLLVCKKKVVHLIQLKLNLKDMRYSNQSYRLPSHCRKGTESTTDSRHRHLSFSSESANTVQMKTVTNETVA